jgi:hypothetical protein
MNKTTDLYTTEFIFKSFTTLIATINSIKTSPELVDTLLNSCPAM